MNSEVLRRNQFTPEQQRTLVNAELWRTCLNCQHWNGGFHIATANGPAQAPKCELFNAMPPPNIILHGCKDHETDDIPF